MTQNPKAGDRVRLVLTGEVLACDPKSDLLQIQPDYMPGSDMSTSLSHSMPILAQLLGKDAPPPGVGDEVEITVRGVVEGGIENRSGLYRGYLGVRLQGQTGSYGFDPAGCDIVVLNRAPKTEVAELEPAELTHGDRVLDTEDDWGIVVFNDTFGRQLLVAFDQGNLGRGLIPYDMVRRAHRPADAVVDEPETCSGPQPPEATGWEEFLKAALDLGLDEVAARDAWEDPAGKGFAQLEAETLARSVGGLLTSIGGNPALHILRAGGGRAV